MRFARTYAAAVSLVLAIPVIAQQGTTTQTADPGATSASTNALTALQNANRQAGWAVDWSAMSFTYTGTVTTSVTFDPNAVPVSISGEFKGRWMAKVAGMQNGAKTTSIVNGQNSSVSSGTGSQTMPWDAIYDSLAIFPFLSDLTALSEAAISASDDGLEIVGPVQAHRFTIHRAAATDPTQSRSFSLQTADTRVWLALDTLLPVQSEHYRPGIDNSSARIIVRDEYADYRTINGIAVPSTVREFMNGALVCTYSIKTIQFGVNVPDSDFIISN